MLQQCCTHTPHAESCEKHHILTEPVAALLPAIAAPAGLWCVFGGWLLPAVWQVKHCLSGK